MCLMWVTEPFEGAPFMPSHDTTPLLQVNLCASEMFQTGVFLSIPHPSQSFLTPAAGIRSLCLLKSM